MASGVWKMIAVVRSVRHRRLQCRLILFVRRDLNEPIISPAVVFQPQNPSNNQRVIAPLAKGIDVIAVGFCFGVAV